MNSIDASSNGGDVVRGAWCVGRLCAVLEVQTCLDGPYVLYNVVKCLQQFETNNVVC